MGAELDDIWCRLGDGGRVLLINALTAILASAAVSKAVKAFWREPRPNGEDNNSFPSQHAAECFAAAVSLDRQFNDGIRPACDRACNRRVADARVRPQASPARRDRRRRAGDLRRIAGSAPAIGCTPTR